MREVPRRRRDASREEEVTLFTMRIGAMGAMLLVASPAAPLLVQAAPAESQSTVSDETVAKTGAALRDVSKITGRYEPRIRAAQNEDERGRITDEEVTVAKQAISDQGLTIDEYQHVMEMARADPGLRERLIRAASSGE
jgi:hypothetical protein